MTTNGNGATTKGYFFEDLAVGMEASYAKKITNDDVLAFADLSGDTNPVHLDDAYAAGTMFKQRIAHGFLTASLFSTVLGTKLPGPGCIYLSQSLKFRAPVHIGDEVVATGKITSLDPEKGRAVLAMQAAVNGKSVLDGEAVMMVPRRERAVVCAQVAQAIATLIRNEGWMSSPVGGTCLRRQKAQCSPSAISMASIAAIRRCSAAPAISPKPRANAPAPWCSSRIRASSSRPTSPSSA